MAGSQLPLENERECQSQLTIVLSHYFWRNSGMDLYKVVLLCTLCDNVCKGALRCKLLCPSSALLLLNGR